MELTSTAMADLTEEQIQIKTKRSLLWFAIISIVMLFAGLTSGYIVRQGEGKWVQFALPSLFSISTIIIVASSVTMEWARRSVRKNNLSAMRTALVLTLLLGVGFMVIQYLAWSDLFHKGIAFTGRVQDIKTSFTYIPGKDKLADNSNVGNVAGSFLYVITGLHVLHLLAGIIALIVVFSHANQNKYTSEKHNGVSMCTIYWHFLSGLWVYLFFFLLYIR